MVNLVKAKGGKVTREPGAVKGGSTVIAVIEDPTGYKFELLQRGPTPEPLCQVMLRVGDLDRSIDFYRKVSSISLLPSLSLKSFGFVFDTSCSDLFNSMFLVFPELGRPLAWNFSVWKITLWTR